MYRPLINCESVEILIKSTNQRRFNFDFYPNLSNKVITRIDTARNYLGASPNNKTLIDSTAQSKAFLTMSDKTGKEFLYRMPLSRIDSLSNNHNRFLINNIIDFEKSYVEFGDTSDLSVNEVIYFLIYYESKEEFFKRQVIHYKKLKADYLSINVNSVDEQRFYLPDNLKFKNKEIVNFYFESANDILYTPEGDDIVSETVFNKSYLTLSDKYKDFAYNIPLYFLKNSVNNYFNRIFLDAKILEFPRSYIYVANITGLSLNSKFLATVEYLIK